MFWSLVLEPGKRYSSTVKESFHLSMATLDIKSCKNDSEICPVLIEVDGQELLLCNLSKSCSPHANLDLVFQKGTDITFYTNGKAVIHLTGYCIQDDMTDDDYSSLEDEEDESFSDLVENTKKVSGKIKLENKPKSGGDKQNPNKRKFEPVEVASKKKPKGVVAKADNDNDEDEDDSDDSSGDFDDSKFDELMDSVNTEDDSSEEDSDFDDEDDSEGDGEDDDDDDNDDDDEDDDEDDSEDDKPKQKPSKKQEVKTPLSNKQKTPISSKKQEKQLNKSQLTNGSTPQSSKKDKKNQANQPTPKPDQKTPNKDAQKTPKKGESTPQAQKKTTLNGGVVVEELKQGNGAPAKYGKMVQVYYTGRLKNNNRVFDQSNQGPGFKFRLGNGEVIKGWDVALNGMKVGGKRRITIPPGMAYGNKGSPPSIPPNSWLIFDVEMKSVN